MMPGGSRWLWMGLLFVGAAARGVYSGRDPPAASPDHVRHTPAAPAGHPIASPQPTAPIGHGPFPPKVEPVQLPALGPLGEAGCSTQIDVQSVGREPGVTVLLAWGTTMPDAGACPGPLAVRCSGLLQPGASWRFVGADLPADTHSGILFSFNVRALRAIGGGEGVQTVADYLCKTLALGGLADCAAYGDFRMAYEEGKTFAGVPLGRAYGPDFVATVHRRCQPASDIDRAAEAAYAGLAGRELGQVDRVFGVSTYYATPIYGDWAGRYSMLHVQNGDVDEVSVEVWLQALGECNQPHLCQRFSLVPGVSMTIDLGPCTGSGWRGSAWVHGRGSSGHSRLAVVADGLGADSLTSYAAVPADLRYSPDSRPLFSAGSPVLYAPMPFSPRNGWRIHLYVVNLSDVDTARVKATFVSRTGRRVLAIRDAAICPRGVQALTLTPADSLEDSGDVPLGMVRVESLPWQPPGGRLVQPPNISAVAELVRPESAGSTGPPTVAFELLPEQRAFDWPVGAGSGGLTSGVGRLAVPGLEQVPGDSGDSTAIVVANLVPVAGATRIVLALFDANGPVAIRCMTLGAEEVAVIDLATWAKPAPRFRGGAVISAVSWSHPVPALDPGQPPVRNLVGLAALVLRHGPRAAAAAAAGDHLAAVMAIPMRTDDTAALPDMTGLPPDPVTCPPVPPVGWSFVDDGAPWRRIFLPYASRPRW